jgi:hypothetical protein
MIANILNHPACHIHTGGTEESVATEPHVKILFPRLPTPVISKQGLSIQTLQTTRNIV